MDGFLASYTKTVDGRYVVRYPIRRQMKSFGNSYKLALRMLNSQEKRFVRDSELYNAYRALMEEYEQLGHRMKVNPGGNHELYYYLPHHFVIKESSLTTKVKVVFNSSQVNNTGVSLIDNYTRV